jgi:hypothetical protein
MEQFLSTSTSLPFAAPDRFETTGLMNLKAALVIAHPGHELCVHGWLSLAKPVVFVLTDGSGRSGEPRLHSTQRTLSETGARSGAWFGKHTDHVVYQALLHHDLDFFRELAVQLADALEMADVDYVVGDSLEGYNPTHDVCRVLINAAVRLVNQRASGRQVRNFDFPLIGPNLRRGAITLGLNETAFERKASAMRACPELADEVSVGLDGAVLKKLDGLGELGKEIKLLIESRGGAEFFRHESFRIVPTDTSRAAALDVLEHSDSIVSSRSSKPFYERYAEMLVSAGHYQQVIRYVDHVAPVAEALRFV